MKKGETKRDVCLLVEPRHPGRREWGEPWLFELIRSREEEAFTLVLVGAWELSEEQLSQLPDNVAEVIVCGPPEGEAPVGARDGSRWRQARREEDRALRKTRSKWLSPRKVAPLVEVLGKMAHEGSVTRQELGRAFRELSKVAPLYRFELLWRDALGWELLSEASRRSGTGLSFSEFCGLAREIAEPLWRAFAHSARIPEARVYHAVGGLRAGLLSLVLGKTRKAATVFTDNRILPGQFAAEHFRKLLEAEAGERPECEAGLAIRLGWQEKLYRFLLAYTDTLVSSDPLAAELIRETCGIEVEVQHLPASVEVPDEESEESREDGTFEVAGIFGLPRESDVGSFLEAAAGVDRQSEQCRFTLWGEWSDADRAFYAAMADGLSRALEVEFAELDGVTGRLGAFDLVVLSALQEAGEEILEECWRGGVPVIAAGGDKFSGLMRSLETAETAETANGEGRPELHVRAGLGDAAGLEEAMLALLGDHRRREGMAQAAGEAVRGRFDRTAMIAGYRHLYRAPEEREEQKEEDPGAKEVTHG